MGFLGFKRKDDLGAKTASPYDKWARKLAASKDYFALADVFNSGTQTQQEAAGHYLKQAGSEAVDGILQALAKEDWGKQPLAVLLAEIGDPRAVPLLKKLIARASYRGFYKPIVYEFVEKNAHAGGEVKEKCALCGKEEEASRMRFFGRGADARGFCASTCWAERATVLVRELGDCRYYQHGACALGGECSMLADTYTSCHVYQMAGNK